MRPLSYTNLLLRAGATKQIMAYFGLFVVNDHLHIGKSRSSAKEQKHLIQPASIWELESLELIWNYTLLHLLKAVD